MVVIIQSQYIEEQPTYTGQPTYKYNTNFHTYRKFNGLSQLELSSYTIKFILILHNIIRYN